MLLVLRVPPNCLFRCPLMILEAAKSHPDLWDVHGAEHVLFDSQLELASLPGKLSGEIATVVIPTCSVCCTYHDDRCDCLPVGCVMRERICCVTYALPLHCLLLLHAFPARRRLDQMASRSLITQSSHLPFTCPTPTFPPSSIIMILTLRTTMTRFVQNRYPTLSAVIADLSYCHSGHEL